MKNNNNDKSRYARPGLEIHQKDFQLAVDTHHQNLEMVSDNPGSILETGECRSQYLPAAGFCGTARDAAMMTKNTETNQQPYEPETPIQQLLALYQLTSS